MQKERSGGPFFLECLYAALFALGVGLITLLLLCALCFLSEDPASMAGYAANVALVLTAFLCGLFSAKSAPSVGENGAVAPLLRAVSAGVIALGLLLGLSLLVPNAQSGRLTQLLSSLPIYTLCVLGVSGIGGLITVTHRPKKRSVRPSKRLRVSKAARRGH